VGASEGLVAELAGAILDGTPIDWDSAESSADLAERSFLEHLRLVAAVADVHRQPLTVTAHPDTPLAESRDDMPEYWGHLRVLERIGRGAFGEVFRAWDTRLDREVALKLLTTDSSSSGGSRGTSIIEEGRLLARVRHPNVATIYGAERIENRVGLWMELVKGRTLQQALEQGKSFSPAEAIEIGIELCRAVSAVHAAGLLHRDIKTHNVMLTDDGRVVLMDFGTGRELSDSSSHDLAGTPLYIAPELLSRGEPTVRSDVYSLGVLLYHLLTRAYPVRAGSLRDLRQAHERNERKSVRSVRPDVPQKLARVIERATDPKSEQRYQNVEDLRAALAAQTPRARNVRLAYAAGIAAAIFLIAAIAWQVRGRTVPATSQHVIAVLPLQNLSTEPDSDYFADGLTDEIIRNLAVVQGLQVRSRTSSFAFKDKPRNLRDVGEQLGANLVVEGSVLRSGNKLRINAQLVQVAGDVPLWTERFERELDDIFAIQDEISRAIVTKLRLTLGTGQRRYDTDVDTYNLYLRARALLIRRGFEDPKAAIGLFEQVVKKDPAFAPAYAGLADAYGLMSHPSLAPGPAEVALPLMQQAADKALELDALLAEGHAAKGFIAARRREWEQAETFFRRAIDLNPSLTLTYINYFWTTLVPLEKLDESERVLQVALQNDPLSATVHDQLGFLALLAGRYDEAVDRFNRARAIDPDLPFLTQHIGRALTFAGRVPEALAFWDTKMDPLGRGYWKDMPGGQPWVALTFVKGGRRDEVERWAEVHKEPYRLALIHAALGNKNRVFEELDKAATASPHRVVPLLVYPEMQLLRGDPRLAELRKRLRLP
jgi:serine/threonine-protein kinase